MPRPKKIDLDPTDQCKLLLGDMSIAEMESVKRYLDYFLDEKKKAEKAKAAQ